MSDDEAQEALERELDYLAEHPEDRTVPGLDEFLDETREALGLTWAEVAEQADMSLSGLRRIRTGATVPRAHSRRALEGALRLPPGHLDRVLAGAGVNPEDYRTDDVPSPLLAGPAFVLPLSPTDLQGLTNGQLQAVQRQVAQILRVLLADARRGA